VANRSSPLTPERGLFGKLTAAQFLRRYWQKRPLLVRNAFPAFRDPVTRDELAGLACERDVESRLVMERGGRKPWDVVYGPQRAARLRRLPRSHWTLLVQHVDRFVPDAAALLERFRFILDWRVDDVMVSVAPRGGSVGPHIDSYDVFLIQGQGRRRWRIDSNAPRAWRPGLDLRILKKFRAEKEWVLKPGDMLYLPPNLAHYGVALDECLTYSIGFRAPAALELLAKAHERLASSSGADEFYRDPALRPTQTPAEISREALRRMRRLMERSLRRLSAPDFDALAGEFLTEPKGDAAVDERPVAATVVRSQLKKGRALVRLPGSRIAFARRGSSIDFFANGRRFPLGASLAFAAPLFTRDRKIPAKILAPHLRESEFVALVCNLIAAGAFELER